MESGARAPAECAGLIRRETFPSQTLGRDWRYVIYTPPGHETSGARYPVLYLLHGNHGSPDDFIDAGELGAIADGLIGSGRMPPAIIAMPDGGDSWYLNHEANRMADAILAEFMPRIERTERVIAGRAARHIGGISMGGYGSLHYALLRPDLFSAVALMSPAAYADLPHEGSSAYQGPPFCVATPSGEREFVPDLWRRAAYPSIIDKCLDGGDAPRFYIDSGDADEFGIATEARRIYEHLRARGQRATFGLTPGGTHDWPTWKIALERALPWILANAPAPEADA